MRRILLHIRAYGAVIWLRLAALAGWPLFIGTGWLYLEQRDRTTAVIEQCNTAAVQAALEAERVGRASDAEHYREVLRELSAAHKRDRQALVAAKDAAAAARRGTETREATIRRLRREAEENAIPDGLACLNAYADERSLDRLRVQAGDPACTGPGADGGTVCADPDGPAGTDTADGNQADRVTYADVLILWGRDRDTIQTLNGQKLAIKQLQESHQ